MCSLAQSYDKKFVSKFKKSLSNDPNIQAELLKKFLKKVNFYIRSCTNIFSF